MPPNTQNNQAPSLLERLHELGWPTRIFALVTADLLGVLLAQLMAFALAYDTVSGEALFELLQRHQTSMPVALVGFIGLFFVFRLYRCAWRFASLGTLRSVILATTCGILLTALLQWLLDPEVERPATLVIFWMLAIMAVGGLRVLLRLANLTRSHGLPTASQFRRDQAPVRVAILGSGSEAVRTAQALSEDPMRQYKVIGFLDETPQRHGMLIQDIPVLGPPSMLPELLRQEKLDEVLVAAPDIHSEALKRQITAARELSIPVRMVPGVHDVLAGRTQLSTEEIRIEDLLHRPPVSCDIREMGRCLDGKRILVTGAGGSIGSELCRQLAAFNPSELVLLGHGENSIDRIQKELLRRFPSQRSRIHMVIGSVADERRIDEVFAEHKPQVVFHAAAHKHVPIMEDNIKEAVQNNALGSYRVASAAGRHGAERFVMVSTDKAVYPSSVMGATKWLAEEAVRHVATRYPHTIYVTTRFGNVLGSRGSVVNIFRDQITRGGPVTVTDPEMTRYFMTIPEAVQLVVQAGAIGGSGELFLLEMGKPMKIVELARDMIRLAGYIPDQDIDVVFTGLRPGEKLHESLAMDDEEISDTGRPGLKAVQRRRYFADGAFEAEIQRLAALRSEPSPLPTLEVLIELVPSKEGEPGLRSGAGGAPKRKPWVTPHLQRLVGSSVPEGVAARATPRSG
ncbi:MAG: NAD-dependent epimerase/dehydratase family protein [Armatimonadia bacterium]|nr:NAD-dependent epimerase/dehydratase family protein [Armatimonadia bacterium]